MFVITVVAARQLPPRSFGVFALGTTIGWLLAVAGDFGMQMHLARAAARAPQHAAAQLIRWSRVRIATGTAGLGVLAVVTVAAGTTRDVARPLLLIAAAYTASGLVEFFTYFFRGLSRSEIESSLILAQRMAMLVCAVAVLWWRPDVTSLGLAMLGPALIALVWAKRRAACLAPAAGLADAGPALRDMSREFITEVAPIGAGVLLSALYFRIDVLLVEWWAGTDAVARYNAVFRLVDALRLFPAAVLAVMLPALCRADDLRPLARAAAVVTGFASAAALVFWRAAGWIVYELYGTAYAASIPALRILTLALPLMALNYALTCHLVAQHRQRAYAIACAAALVVNLALNARLIPLLSIDGAAWATVATEAALTAACVAALYPRA